VFYQKNFLIKLIIFFYHTGISFLLQEEGLWHFVEKDRPFLGSCDMFSKTTRSGEKHAEK